MRTKIFVIGMILATIVTYGILVASSMGVEVTSTGKAIAFGCLVFEFISAAIVCLKVGKVLED